jgi:hypothetical protein
VPQGKSPAPPPLELTDSTLPVIGGPAPRPRPRPPELPLWAKWALSLLVGACLLVALILFVDRHNTDSTPGYPVSAKAAQEANREATVLEEQDQAPRVLVAAPVAAPANALARAVHVVMAQRIATNLAGPPLKRASCRATATRGELHGYACSVLSGGVYYDFVGVIVPRTRTITLCKRDPPPVPSENVPVSRRCLA